MKKIAFSDKYGLTQAVIDGRKTMTRRIIPDIEIDWNRRGCIKVPISGFEHGVLLMDISSILPGERKYPAPLAYQPKYLTGFEVAVAQRYKDIAGQVEWAQAEWANGYLRQDHPGWSNKMFTRADLMPHRIRINNVKLERLQDISDEDCLHEGIMEGEFMNTWDRYYYDMLGDVANHITSSTPRKAFASLIDRISGRGTWERNPYVYAYSFELVKDKEK